MVDKLPQFKQIDYVTSDGERCSATKNGDTVTIQGDKNGVRQVPMQEFLPEFIKDQAQKGSLERTPEADTVNFSGKNNESHEVNETILYHDIHELERSTIYSRPSNWKRNYTMDYEGSGVENGHPQDSYHLKVENKMSGRKVKGEIYCKKTDLKVKSSALNILSGEIKGTWDGQPIDVKYKETKDRKGLEIKGKLPNDDLVPILALMVTDKVQQQTLIKV